MRTLLTSAAVLLGLLAGACKCPWEGRNVWLATDASQGKTLETSAGDELLLDLPVTPGSKAKWFFIEIDEKILERKGPAEDLPGGKSVRVPFSARQPGVTDLEAIYARTRSAPPEKTFRMTVWVR